MVSFSAVHLSRNDGDGFDDGEPDVVPDITFTGSGRVTSRKREASSLPLVNPECSVAIIMRWGQSGMVITSSLIWKISSTMLSDRAFIRRIQCIVLRVRDLSFRPDSDDL